MGSSRDCDTNTPSTNNTHGHWANQVFNWRARACATLLISVSCHWDVGCEATIIYAVWLQRVTNTGQLDNSFDSIIL